MGGIFGFACKDKVNLSVIGEGLRRLAYRGYDGAGFGFLDDNGLIIVRKTVGHIERVMSKLGFDSFNSNIAVGHTRYASRGVPADFNSHPLLDCKGNIAVVMDGVIYKYEDLREELKRRGHRFTSTTDTEVLAHIVEELLGSGLSLQDILLDAGRRVDGLYSTVIMITGLNALGLISKGQPLVLGLKPEGPCIYVSSDIASLYGFSDEAVILEDNIVSIVTPGGFKILSLESGLEILEYQRKKVKYPLEAISKAGYPHYMLKEIYEIPDALLRTTVSLMDKYLRLSAMIIANARNVIVIGNGTSLHAGLISQYYFADLAGINVNVVSAAEFPYYALNNVITGTVVLAISQSGETSDVIRSIKLAKQRGAVIVGITNVLGSRLTIHSNVYLPIGAGPEIAVPATKTFTSTLATLAILAGYTGLYTGRFDKSSLENMYIDIKNTAKITREELPRIESQVSAIAEDLVRISKVYVTSSGISYPIALEGALKLKEASLVHAEGVQLGELRHGPLVLAGREHPIILVEPVEDQALELYEKVLGEIRSRDVHTIRLGFREDSTIRLPKTTRITAPIVSIIPLQLLAYKIGVIKTLPIDTPPGLAKAITT
ncbi:MAG: glutamine--fructose-6-phosphate transaminase (isomerizing) [Acidilobaceae archaeon]